MIVMFTLLIAMIVALSGMPTDYSAKPIHWADCGCSQCLDWEDKFVKSTNKSLGLAAIVVLIGLTISWFV